MINDQIITELKQTPIFKTSRCRFLAYALSYILKFGTLIFSAFIWYVSDYFFAIASLLLFYVVMGIVRSKLLHISIPGVQQEHNYSDLELAHWFLDRRYCFENSSNSPNLKVL